VLSSTVANTNGIGIATVTIYSTTPGFATVIAQVTSGVGQVRDQKTVFFSSKDVLAVSMALDVDADNDLIYDEPSDLLLGETPTDTSVKIRARVYNAGGVLLPGRQVMFDSERPYRVGTSIVGTDQNWKCSDDSDTCWIAFPLGRTMYTNENGEAFAQVIVGAESLRNFTSNLSIFASADNGASNMKTLFLSPVSVSSITVVADPPVLSPSTLDSTKTSKITATALTNFNQPVPDGTTINFEIDSACRAAGGTITPFGRTGVDAKGDGKATATFTAPSKSMTCTVTASVGGVSGSVDVLVTTKLSIIPTSFSIGTNTDGLTGGLGPSGTVSVQYIVTGGVAPYVVHFTLLQFIDSTSPTKDGDTVGVAGTNSATFTVKYTFPDDQTATFHLVVTDSIGGTVTSEIKMAP